MRYAAKVSAAALPRLLAGADPSGRPATLDAHRRSYGPGRSWTPEQLIAEVEQSGLRGRGGGSFPTARKLATLATRRSVSAVVVNGSETEPASEKDLLLMSTLPHLVLDGAHLAADAVSASELIFVLGPRSGAARTALKRAVTERGDHRPVRLVESPGGYVSGEESAVINLLEKGRAIPTATPPRPFERGYRGQPTLIQNPETLAHLALIGRFGARWFRTLGTPADPGTVLTTVSGAVRYPGVYEIAFGTTLGELLAAAGGGMEHISAVLIGGYFGAWAGAAAANRIVLAQEPLRAAGHALGAGVLIVRGEHDCALHDTVALVEYLAGQSAGQCGPCVYGLRDIAYGFANLVNGRGEPALLQELHRWIDQVDGRGACHHPNGVVRLVRSALRTFGHELAGHDHSCPSRLSRLPGLIAA